MVVRVFNLADNTTVPAPRVANISTSPGTVTWQSSSNFNGYIWLGLRIPSPTGSFSYSPQLYNTLRRQQIPQFIKVPIINGIVDGSTQVYWNADIDPPGTSYVAYYLDDNNVLIAPASGTATPFTVASTAVTLTIPTLPVPVYSTAAPVPES